MVLKHLISIILTTAIILQSFSSLVVMAGYEMNMDYITKKYCENKDKPMLHCNGKCHMQKQLKEQEKNDQTPTAPSKEKQETIQFFQNYNTFSFVPFENISKNIAFYLETRLPEISFSIFHPPAC